MAFGTDDMVVINDVFEVVRVLSTLVVEDVVVLDRVVDVAVVVAVATEELELRSIRHTI
jgi:hypothetical protein